MTAIRGEPGPSDNDHNGPEDFYHIDVFRTNRYGEPQGARIDRMTRYPMVESECRVMLRKLTRRDGIVHLLTKVRTDE
jgi:hypothetical protein